MIALSWPQVIILSLVLVAGCFWMWIFVKYRGDKIPYYTKDEEEKEQIK